MKKNQLGRSSLYVSEIGFGCMSLSNDDQANERIIHEAIDRGINFFDTADLYGKGMNEISVGKALRGKRNNIILASKGGNEWGDGIDGWRWNPTKAYIKEAVKRSLQRLQTDYIDLYQLHGGTIEDPFDETVEAFEELVDEGVIRYYGISSIRPNVIKKYANSTNIVSVMMQYSLLDRRPEELFSLLDEKEISVIARGPVAKGLLTNSYNGKLVASEGYLDYSKEELIDTIPALYDLAQKNSFTLQQLAIHYVLTASTVATTIPGASSLEQLLDNVAAANVTNLSSALIEELQRITKQTIYQDHRD